MSMFLVTAWPVMVCQRRKKKLPKAEKLKIIMAKPKDSSDGSPILVFCKWREQKSSKPSEDSKSDTVDGFFSADPTLDFPFLNDPFTRNVIHNSKIMFLMRGLPGSGKSTVVSAITHVYPGSVVCSADDYFLRDGVYYFDVRGLSSAHSSCQRNAQQACENGVSVVIVDNTNVRRWEMKFYLELASSTDYVVVLVEPKTPWKWNPRELAARNKHGVDVETLDRKVGQFDDVIPVYYAWFLDDMASQWLSSIYHSLLQECLQCFPDLAHRLLRQLSAPRSGEMDWDTHWGLLQAYYTASNKKGSLVHCTAKFCGGGKAVGAKSYHARQAVQNALGRAFTVTITSICFSPRSAGARVQLSEEQMQLFDKPEERDWDGVQPRSATAGPAGSPQTSPWQKGSSSGWNSRSPNQKRGSPQQNARSGKGTRNSPNSGGEATLHTVDDHLTPARTRPLASLPGRSAHITLGSGEGFASRETNFDVLRLCDMEAGRPAREEDFVPVTGGRARYFGDGVCCVYFYEPLHVHTIYSGFY